MVFKIKKTGKTLLHGIRDWSSTYNSTLNENKILILLLDNDKETVGQIMVYDKNFIANFAIDPNYRNSGLGSKLLKRAEKYIKENTDSTEIQLTPQKEFEDTLIPWYEKRGYEIIDFLVKADEFLMVKKV